MPWTKRDFLTGLGLAIAAFAACAAVAGTPEKPGVAAPEAFSALQKDHWAYKPIVRAPLPAVTDRAWVRNPIDAFILASLEEVGGKPSPEASRVALIRRLTFDLTGLPPTPAETTAFLADSRPDAYERLVDRLLASPRFGERWGQHWLDLAHYADSNGFELDAERPDAWRYRDWVISAQNSDLPYDRFVALQLAGDELAPGDPGSLIATGFCRSGPREVVGGNVIPEVKRQTELSEITGTVGSVFMGLTMGCARCHDHKFDAIPSTDYYRLQAFFAASELTDVPIASEQERKAYEAASKAIEAKTAPLRKAMSELEAPYRAALSAAKTSMLTPEERLIAATPEKDRTPSQKKRAKGLETSLRIIWEEVAEAVHANPADHARREALKHQIYELERTLPRPPAHAMALVDEREKADDVFVLRRGDYRNRGPRVSPRPPGVILASQRGPAFTEGSITPRESKTGRRSALAAWMARTDNPLTPRVIVNRLWQHHYGRGIVATPSDFGVRGESPTHPELLDWLAAELVDQGWRLKPIHRLMVTSAAYRQASDPATSLAADDPENDFLSHMNRRRLDAEGIRDAMLCVSGDLNPRMGGPGVIAPLEKEIKDLIFTEQEVVDLWPVDPSPAQYHRRSIYLFRKRNVRYPLLDAFDAPDTQTACPRRETSTHALQALTLINGEFTTERARMLAALALGDPGGRDHAVQALYRRVLARKASQSELARARGFLAIQAELLAKEGSGSKAEKDAWVDFAIALLNCNEFLYVP